MSASSQSDGTDNLLEAEPAQLTDALAVADSEVSATRQQRFAATALCVCGFLTFYLLSAGPVAGIHNVLKVRAFQKAVEVIYAPVVLLVKSNVEPFSSIMKWYVDLFR
tara:strand:+ start:53297 stop:53620 length:324 start_codon:yes stop_codon:yes gene_type:complete